MMGISFSSLWYCRCRCRHHVLVPIHGRRLNLTGCRGEIRLLLRRISYTSFGTARTMCLHHNIQSKTKIDRLPLRDSTSVREKFLYFLGTGRCQHGFLIPYGRHQVLVPYTAGGLYSLFVAERLDSISLEHYSPLRSRTPEARANPPHLHRAQQTYSESIEDIRAYRWTELGRCKHALSFATCHLNSRAWSLSSLHVSR